MAYPVDAITTDFQIFFDVPIRAYPGIGLINRVSYYEIDNRGILWTLTGAPPNMNIGADGTITWPSPVLGTYAGITITARRGSWDSINYPASGLTTTKTFTCICSTAGYLFVATAASSPAGNNANPGTIAAPKLTIANALLTAGAVGKTIMVRAGNYTETFSAEIGAGVNYTVAAYLEVMAYPGEAVNVIMTNYGFEVETSEFIIFRDLNITGCTHLEGGQISLKGVNCLAKDCVCHGSAWDGNANTTGMLLGGVTNIINRCVSFNNIGVSGNVNNFSNFLIYNDDAGVKWLMNSKGYQSTFNWKIKHTTTNNSKCIIHNIVGVNVGSIGYGRDSSVRYNVVYEGVNWGLYAGLTDPSSFTMGGMFWQHNTVIAAASAPQAFGIQDGYGTAGTLTWLNNILYQSHGQSGPGNDNKKMLQMYQYTIPLVTARGLPYNGDCNIYRNTTNLTDSFIVGSNGVSPTTTDLVGYKTFTGAGINRDPNSSGADPAFANVAVGDLNIIGSSSAATLCVGNFSGAFRPDQVYGLVNGLNTTLVEWAAAPPGPAPVRRLISCQCG